MVKTRASGGGAGGGAQMATGTYTGDGAANQGIVGVGFQPQFVYVYSHTSHSLAGCDMDMSTDQDGGNANCVLAASHFSFYGATIPSLDADGFTVRGHLNNNGEVYTYIAFG
jgi:hypothetical protein